VDSALLNVEDLPSQREHGLGVAVTRAHGRATSRIALDDEQLRERRILDRAVGELARKRGVLKRRLASGEVPRLPSSVASLGGLDGLRDDRARFLWVLLEELAEAPIDDRVDESLQPRVAELGLRLTLELRVRELHRDHGGQPLPDVLAREVLVLLLEKALGERVLVQRARESGAESAQMAAALDRVDVVGERKHRLLIGGVPLHRDLERALLALALERDDL